MVGFSEALDAAEAPPFQYKKKIMLVFFYLTSAALMIRPVLYIDTDRPTDRPIYPPMIPTDQPNDRPTDLHMVTDLPAHDINRPNERPTYLPMTPTYRLTLNRRRSSRTARTGLPQTPPRHQSPPLPCPSIAASWHPMSPIPDLDPHHRPSGSGWREAEQIMGPRSTPDCYLILALAGPVFLEGETRVVPPLLLLPPPASPRSCIRATELSNSRDRRRHSRSYVWVRSRPNLLGV